MRLLLDVGNTCCKSALLVGNKLAQFRSVCIDDDPTRCVTCIPRSAINAVWAVSVRDDSFNLRLVEAVQQRFSLRIRFAKIAGPTCGIRSRYTSELGVDRFMALIAAWQRYGTSCIVVDCGTAVTVDALDGTGVHCGGLIMPGLKLLEKSLYCGTDQLWPAFPLEPSLFARSTGSAVYSGCHEMWQAGIRSVCRAMSTQLGCGTIVCSGGDSARLCTAWQDAEHAPDLVLAGLVTYMHSNAC